MQTCRMYTAHSELKRPSSKWCLSPWNEAHSGCFQATWLELPVLPNRRSLHGTARRQYGAVWVTPWPAVATYYKSEQVPRMVQVNLGFNTEGRCPVQEINWDKANISQVRKPGWPEDLESNLLFPSKKTRSSWRNGWFQVWDRERMRWVRSVLLYQKAKTLSDTPVPCQRGSEPTSRGSCSLNRTIWASMRI